MSATKKNQEKEESESEDDFQYEEISLEDDWSLTEGEEDLEATVKAIQDRAEAVAAAKPTAHQSEVVGDFLRNFLFQMGMTQTLDCLQTEWSELVQKGLLDTERVGVVPDVYAENKRLESELKNAQREGKEYKLAVSAAAETLMRVQKARDFHRLQHKRVIQEKNRLIEEIRKLKVQCSSSEPALKRMHEKYQAVLKQTMLVTLETDKALGQASRQSGQHDIPEASVKGKTLPLIHPRPPTTAKPQGVRPGCSQ